MASGCPTTTCRTPPTTVRAVEPALDCWTMLAAVAIAAPNLRLTSMVSPAHHPPSCGAGQAGRDGRPNQQRPRRARARRRVAGQRARGYGFELLEPGERVTHFIEAMRVIRAPPRRRARQVRRTLVHTDRRDVRTQAGAVAAADSRRYGAPADDAGHVATYANEWNTWGSPSTVAAVTEHFIAACATEGRDPSSIRRSAQALVFITDTDAERDELLAKVRPDRAIVGSPAQIVDVLGGTRPMASTSSPCRTSTSASRSRNARRRSSASTRKWSAN